MEHIKTYFSIVIEFLNAPSVAIQIASAKTVRIILNGGLDHSGLKSDAVPWTSEDGASVQVTDAEYIQSLLRAGGAVAVLVTKFRSAVSQLGMAQSSYASSQAPARSESHEDEQEGDRSMSASPLRPAADSESDDDTSAHVGNDDVKEETGTSDLKRRMYDYRKLTEGMLYVCLDMSMHAVNAASMCSEGVSDASLMLIEITNNPRDTWTSKCVELLWNCLEAFHDLKDIRSTADECGDFLPPEEMCRHDTAVLSFDIAIGVLRNLFLVLIFEGYRNADKELRNEIIIVLSLIAKDARSIPYFVHSGMLTDLVTYSCAAEAGADGWFYSSRPMAKLRNFASVFDVDLQLKRELWLLLSDLLKQDDPDVLLCVAASPFLRVLCKYLEFDTTAHGNAAVLLTLKEPNNENDYEPQTLDEAGLRTVTTDFSYQANSVSTLSLPPPNRKDVLRANASSLGGALSGSVDLASDMLRTELLPMAVVIESQSRDTISDVFLASVPIALMCELKVLAANVLGECSHRMMAEFLRIGGPAIALAAVEKYTDSTLAEHKTFVNGCLLLLNKCVSYSDVGKKKLEDLCAIKSLLLLFETSDDDATKGQVLRLFSIMCIGSPVAQVQMRESDGIPALVRALAKFPAANRPLVGQTSGMKCPGLQLSQSSPDAATEEVSSFMVALLDAIWMSIIGNARNESIFAECAGTDALLEALECSSFLLRSMILRVVSDLLMNKRLLAFVESWRSSRSMRSVNQLLAHAWMDEEVRLAVSREGGVLCNMWNPLSAHDWPLDPRLQDRKTNMQVGPSLRVGASDSVMAGSVNTDNTSSVWFPANLDNGESPPKTSIVEKLSNAVTLSRRETAGSRVALSVRLEAASKDMRGVIASIFTTLGLFDGDIIESGGISDSRPISAHRGLSDDAASVSSSTTGDGQHVGVLSPSDKQVLCVAKRYDTLREGEWWKAVFDELRNVGVNPIEEDLRMIELKLDASFEATQAAQFEQMELQALDKRIKVKSEDAFMGQILRQKHQQIKSEWLKKNAHREKTNKNKQFIAAAANNVS